MAIRQVYFDLNGTLFDPSAMAEPLDGEADELVDEILGEAVLMAMVETLSGSYRDFAELLKAAASRQLALAGTPDLVDEVGGAAQEMRPFVDAGEAIARLRSAGLRVGVLTNSSTESADSLVSRSGLGLEPIVGTDQVRAFKPDRRVYERGAKAAGASVEEVALITAHGWDAIGAKRAGMVAAWVARKERIPPRIDPAPDIEAETLLGAAEAIGRGVLPGTRSEGAPVRAEHGVAGADLKAGLCLGSLRAGRGELERGARAGTDPRLL